MHTYYVKLKIVCVCVCVCIYIYELSICIENFNAGCLYAYKHILHKQRHSNEFCPRLCQHHTVYSIYIFIFIAAIIYFYVVHNFDVLILYSFVLILA